MVEAWFQVPAKPPMEGGARDRDVRAAPGRGQQPAAGGGPRGGLATVSKHGHDAEGAFDALVQAIMGFRAGPSCPRLSRAATPGGFARALGPPPSWWLWRMCARNRSSTDQ